MGYWANELMEARFDPLKSVVDGLFVEGLTVCAGPPKLGKSFMLLNTGLAVASGGMALGKIPVEQGEVLFLALEDSPRRIQDRMKMMLGDEHAPSTLRIETWWRPVIDGGADDLNDWLDAHPDCRLVIVDVYARLRAKRKSKEDPYQADYQEAELFKTIADEHRVAVVLNTHTRKLLSDDFIDMVSGTLGIAGAADTVIVLQRSRGRTDAQLKITGRDVEEQDLALTFSPQVGSWTLQGDAAEYLVSKQRQAIMAALGTTGGDMGPKEIAELSGVDYDVVRHLVGTMAEADQIAKGGRGTYSLHSQRSQTLGEM